MGHAEVFSYLDGRVLFRRPAVTYRRRTNTLRPRKLRLAQACRKSLSWRMKSSTHVLPAAAKPVKAFLVAPRFNSSHHRLELRKQVRQIFTRPQGSDHSIHPRVPEGLGPSQRWLIAAVEDGRKHENKEVFELYSPKNKVNRAVAIDPKISVSA